MVTDGGASPADSELPGRWMENASVADSVDLALAHVDDDGGQDDEPQRDSTGAQEDPSQDTGDEDDETQSEGFGDEHEGESSVQVLSTEEGRDDSAEDDADTGAEEDGYEPPSTTAPPPPSAVAGAPLAVQAPPFTAVHRSWEEFDAQLKGYAQSTYQLYVVRTTTSVQRRNIRIAELAASATTAESGNVDADDIAEEEEDGEPGVQPSDGHSERLMIPPHLKWYSKTMMCTHGWKDRHRGTGKRSITMVRSTGCPVKMCITLQHSNEVSEADEDDDGWRVVVTKHVRTHNHPLSKELYLFYTENRRIYDPELLALVGGNSPSGAPLAADFYGAFGDDDEDNTLSSTAAQGHEETMPGSSVPMTPKAFASWEQFHECLGDYSLSTQQHFRIRSTISTQSKNAKTLEQASKTGKSIDEISVLLVPEDLKWYSKLLICNHGWKRKSRSKLARFQRQSVVEEWNDSNPNACPAMVMARLQRDIHDKWRIVINRQVTNHNHALYAFDPTEADHEGQLVDGTASELEESSAAVALMNPALTTHQSVSTEDQQNEEFVNAAVQHLGDLDLPAPSEASVEQNDPHGTIGASPHASTFDPQPQPLAESHLLPRPMSVVTEVVVRVAKLQAIHESWEAFHTCLQQYSESTYQSYRTRTTSSVAGRNQKIMEMRANNETSGVGEGEATERDGEISESTRLIPEHYKWYSKTLTCTHGWKERRRGSGKRTIHIVRSTLCPVKICATLQYLETESQNAGEVGWRVVVTKHIVDHNHNLSKELYQHYRNNRRIYDPALLAINQVNTLELPGGTSQTVGAVSSSASRSHTSEVTGPASTEEHRTPHTSVTSVNFEQVQAFNAAQHALPESAYAVPNSGNTGQQLFLMANGTALLSFGTIPAQAATVLHSTTTASSLTSSTSSAMHQMFGSGSVFPTSAYTSIQLPEFTGNASHMSPTASIICQLHGNSTPNDPSGAASAECTCLRIPVVHQYSPEASTTSSLIESSSTTGKRRARSAGDHEANSTQAAKRPRSRRDEHGSEPQHHTSDQSSSFATATAPTIDGNSAVPASSPTPTWSPENPAQVVAMTESDGTVIWRAPRLKRRHENWVEFTDHLNAYSVSTLQLYRVRTTSSIAARNTRIYQQLQQMQEQGGHQEEGEFVPQLVPASYEWYSKTYVCTHGWKERRRGKGQRVSHNLRSTDCPVKLCVTLQRDPHDTENWNVVVTKHVLNHNHEISLSVFQGYSENRRIKDPQLLARAEQMWREGQPRRKVFEFLKGATKSNIVMKDVHNLVQRWQQQQSQPQSNMSAPGEPMVGQLDQDQQAPSLNTAADSELDLIV